ncbi:hypothetical protein AWJ20_1799 [Sugiyamaella lignohabitans]|uniref:DUF202 domain-containing protein n=1 Tax=Sugiyamaella lignohabitans TaxID=796027 RepID=A0A167E0J8_9ASCO|nr:uncharacterized protein AWJ20_1799 [Sugiyamaella lignohabitans]ANB13505.1 hypothetical protein AWJ20_1799 [Sugiyamaella lignohabitans]
MSDETPRSPPHSVDENTGELPERMKGSSADLVNDQEHSTGSLDIAETRSSSLKGSSEVLEQEIELNLHSVSKPAASLQSRSTNPIPPINTVGPNDFALETLTVHPYFPARHDKYGNPLRQDSGPSNKSDRNAADEEDPKVEIALESSQDSVTQPNATGETLIRSVMWSVNDNESEPERTHTFAHREGNANAYDSYVSVHGNTISFVNETDPLLARHRVMLLRSQSKFKLYFSRPLLPPLIFDNHVTEARDLCVAERNFLSGMKMGVSLGVAAAVLYIDLRLPTADTPNPPPHAISSGWATTLGIIFFVLSILTILGSFVNYIQTVASLAMQEAKVTTNKIFRFLLSGIAVIILTTNIVVIAKSGKSNK